MLVFFGVKTTSLSMLEFLITKKFKIDLLVTVNRKIAKKNNISGYYDLSKFAKKNQIRIYHLKSYNINKEDLIFLSNIKNKIGLAYGWQRIIRSEVLKLFNVGVFGFHGSYLQLPNGAGRSPFNWTLRLNKKQIYQNLFKYTDQFDKGPIFNTTKFKIYETDDINSLQYKGFYIAKNQTEKLLNQFRLGKNIKLKKQKKLKKVIHFPKLSFKDSKIDFAKSCNQNLNIIRASSKPFDGSYFYMHDNKILIVNQAKLFLNKKNIFIKKKKESSILDVYNDESFLVQFYDGIIHITDYEFKADIYKYLNKRIY